MVSRCARSSTSSTSSRPLEARRSQRHQAEEPDDAGRELGIGVWLDAHLVHQPAEHRGVPGFFTHLGQRVAAVIARSPVLFHHLPPQHGAEPGLDVNTEAQYRSELVPGQLDALLLGQLVPQLGPVQRRAARRRPVQTGHRRASQSMSTSPSYARSAAERSNRCAVFSRSPTDLPRTDEAPASWSALGWSMVVIDPTLQTCKTCT